MKINQLFLAGSLALLAFGCNKSTTPTQTESTEQTESNDQFFGAEFTPETVISYEELLKTAPSNDSMAVAVRGTVTDVCQAKGCWMTFTSTEGEEMMVKFKDYGFFMPKDIAGREVIMNGMAFYRTTPVDELRHYAEDAGKSAEEIAAITEPKHELSFLADGVILVGE